MSTLQAKQKHNTHKYYRCRYRNEIFETILNMSISVTLDTLPDVYARNQIGYHLLSYNRV